MKKTKTILSSLLLSTMGFLAACGEESGSQDSSAESTEEGSSEESIVLSTANITQADNSLSVVLQNIGDELEERTDGRITAEHNPGGQLGNEEDMMQQLNSGTIDIANITTAQLSNSSPAFGAWLTPFVVETHEQAYELWTSEESMALFDTLENQNVKGLGYSTSGFRYMLSVDPIDSVSDLDGFKLRTTPSPTIMDFWNGVGASPTAMPLTEVYTSLQTNVIDGVDIDTQSLVSENLTEIATNMTPSKHMYWAAGIMMNQERWDSFSEEDQQLIQEVVDEVTKENAETLIEFEENLLENGEDEQGVSIVEFDYSEFDPVTEEVREAWMEKSPEIKPFLEKADEIKSE
ncbi:TRAP transporter substrate-binding protein [Alteribacillus sp. YIM 98480]|uniref:TRAP transporter substrate-binding protein n=1 Tax=Alteribacillus sp. YIM 98480 TaxID=2606599 RepID=UPI00131CC6F5|nr:TRAP transporter substrate-binding protein [Alteribacillus sp. YIM 98480]